MCFYPLNSVENVTNVENLLEFLRRKDNITLNILSAEFSADEIFRAHDEYVRPTIYRFNDRSVLIVALFINTFGTKVHFLLTFRNHLLVIFCLQKLLESFGYDMMNTINDS